MKRTDLRWLTVREFQGLWEAPNLAAPPNAAAQMVNCYPSASGILPAGQVTALHTAADFHLAMFQGLFAAAPLQHSSGGPLTVDLFVAGQNASVNTAFYLSVLKLIDGTISQGVASGTGSGSTPFTGPVWITERRSANTNSTPPTTSSSHIVCGFNSPWSGLNLLEYPSPGSPTVDGFFLFYTNANQVLGALGFHQSRVVWIESIYSFPNMGAGRAGVDFPLLRFTDPNSDVVAASGDYFFLGAGGANALAGFLVPTDVGNLLLARSRDVHLIQGDLGQAGGPSDYVLSFFTGAAQQTPAVTTEGVFFGRADGPVVFWGGGAGTQDVSFGLKPGFWANISMLPFTGQFAWSEPFVLCPNGYVFDIRSRSWFKYAALANVWGWTASFLGTPFFIGANAQKQIAWCCEYGSGGNGNLFQVNLSEDPTTPRVNTWTWQSVPFTLEEVPFLEAREVEVLFQNWTSAAADQCSLALTLTNPYGDSNPVTVSKLTQARSDPQIVRFQLPVVKTESMQLQLVVTATGATANAGICKEIRVGYRESAGFPRIGE